MNELTQAEETRVLDMYQAARKTMEPPHAAIHAIRSTGLPEPAVRAVIARFEYICNGDAA